MIRDGHQPPRVDCPWLPSIELINGYWLPRSNPERTPITSRLLNRANTGQQVIEMVMFVKVTNADTNYADDSANIEPAGIADVVADKDGIQDKKKVIIPN